MPFFAHQSPIFAEIVPEHLRTNVYALDRTFETLVAAFAPTTVGYLTEEVFGYIPPPTNVTTDSGVQVTGDAAAAAMGERDLANAYALAKGLFVCTAIPFVLCCCIYTLLYWSYPVDRDATKAEEAASNREHVRLQAIGGVVPEEDERSGLFNNEWSRYRSISGKSSARDFDELS
eukprot:TRINITY_DN4937_c0_g3_i2.p1 TRINITY_DN4937_c0_g3~~TRINITY_DN4937_c0_g3_i2.p1  ORF type:complete len:175 (-),score=21.74 TRINITY_DN4937_c0_g3_i2:314-838(-)